MKTCASCGVPLADDQRYCMECGSRQPQARSQFLERFTPATLGPTGATSNMMPPAGGRSGNVLAVAGVGVLLLAMGVGVLIGRASGGKTATTPAQVITVSSSPGASTGGEATAPASTTPSAPSGSSSTSPKASSSPTGSPSSSTKSSATPGSSTNASKPKSSGAAKSTSPKSGSSGGGESAEQKTRNIPNVVTTG